MSHDTPTLARERRIWLPVLGLVALGGWLALAVVGGGGGMGACAPPPPGYHSVRDPLIYVWMFGPGTLTFLFTAYFYLRVRLVWARLLLLLACVALPLAVTFLPVAFAPFSCGVSIPN
jgi:hypothetical protein